MPTNDPTAMNSELHLTDTNAASDSKGRTWGLEGNLFWYLVAWALALSLSSSSLSA